jgi:hypothetical protein
MTSILNSTIKFLVVLIVIGIITSMIGNALSAYQNQSIIDEQKVLYDDLRTHIELVSLHANHTYRTLELVEGALVNQTENVRAFNQHLNETSEILEEIRREHPQ